MSDLRDLYQELILDHGRRPRNFGPLPEATHDAIGHNPLCGDKITVHARVRDDVVEGISFEGQGCAISQASASLLTEAVKGRKIGDVKSLFRKLTALVTGRDEDASRESDVELGKLAVFEGVRQYPMRVKCATLAWHTLNNALDGKAAEVARTE
ncbi:MAG TPA: SUF system NifU family Fe-S cluster assembly protein [Candidatus Limnocylindrales bacterium]|nr:SUF system NifU family Fe-S cluster assembly protein [Candidatus Limnocylindrales bacterium]